MMCIQPPCMNIAEMIVTQCWPDAMSAGITDHCFTKGSPPSSSNKKTIALSRMIAAVTTGKRLGRRDASASGIMLTTRSSSVPGDQACAPDFPTHPPLLPKHAASALCPPLSLGRLHDA